MDSLYLFPPDDNTPMKTCTGPCGRTLPTTIEFFHKNRGTKDGLLPKCKQCCLEKQRENNAAKLAPASEGYKRCRKCKKEYLFTAEYWHVDKRYESGLSGPCKQCASDRHAKRYVENRDKIMEQHHQYKSTHKEQIKVYNHLHYIENKEVHLERVRRDRAKYKEKRDAYHRQHYLKNKKRYQEYARLYRDTHREKVRARVNRRRARKLASEGTHTAQQIQEQLKRQKHKCYYCQKRLQKQKGRYVYHVDHIVPLSKGGSNDISNLVIACPFCNDSKGAKLLHDWHQGGRLL